MLELGLAYQTIKELLTMSYLLIECDKLTGIGQRFYLAEKLITNRNNRREETVLSRLHIGHSYLTNAHLLKREAPPVCLGQGCKELLTMSHLLVGCDKLTSIRRRFYVADSMRSLFKNIRPERIFSFLKEIGVFNLI